jgi:hypothetical protein
MSVVHGQPHWTVAWPGESSPLQEERGPWDDVIVARGLLCAGDDLHSAENRLAATRLLH